MRVLTAITLLALVGTTTGAADDPKDAAKKLEGTYEVLEFIEAGKPKVDELESFGIKDGVMSIKTKGNNVEKATFTLDPSKSPAQIDILPDGDKKPVKGIYTVKETDKGLELTIAFGDGPNAERPKDFKADPDQGYLVTLRRKKAK
jgi:uncharacterized protein (TIGR03067 family)